MKPPLKLNSIDQEHLQELYNAAGVARDELPYTTAFEEIVAGFQDRTFKNADAEQLFGALLKYTRSSGNVATEQPPVALSDDQLKQLKAALSRHLIGGKILPYSDEFNAARAEFIKASGSDMPEGDFWRDPQVARLQAAAAASEESRRRQGRRRRGRRVNLPSLRIGRSTQPTRFRRQPGAFGWLGPWRYGLTRRIRSTSASAVGPQHLIQGLAR